MIYWPLEQIQIVDFVKEMARVLRKRDKTHWAQQPRFLDGVHSPYYSASSSSTTVAVNKRAAALPTVPEGTSFLKSSSISMMLKLDSLVAQAGYPTTCSPSGLKSPELEQSEARMSGSKKILLDLHRLAPDVKEKFQRIKRRVGWMMASAFALVGCAIAFAALWTLWEHPRVAAVATGAFIVAESIFWIQFKYRYKWYMERHGHI